MLLLLVRGPYLRFRWCAKEGRLTFVGTFVNNRSRGGLYPSVRGAQILEGHESACWYILPTKSISYVSNRFSREKKLKRTSEGGSEAEVLKIASEVSEVVKVRSSTKDERTVNTKINNWDWDVIIIWGCYDENQTTIRQQLLFHLSRTPSLPADALCPIPIPSDVVLVALASSKPLSPIFGWPALPWLSPCFTHAAVWP
jgi:hypothetical protein